MKGIIYVALKPDGYIQICEDRPMRSEFPDKKLRFFQISKELPVAALTMLRTRKVSSIEETPIWEDR